ncbi:MAG: hypothetical protein AB7R55_05200 [Gemmatimonadales bacterium]
MITVARSRLFALGAIGALAWPAVVPGQAPALTTRSRQQSYTIPGINAWSEAKTQGFTFQPLTYGSGQTVTSPRDGVNTRLTTQTQIGLRRQTVTLAQVVGGNASVVRPGSGSRTVTFEFFGGRTLAPGWSVESVQLGGSYTWDRRVTTGGQDLSFRVKATSYASTTGSVIVRSVTLRGPAGANWADAFEGRRQWTISGISAWGTARSYGFTFAPLEGSAPSLPQVRLDGTPDGVNTLLVTRNPLPNPNPCEVYVRVDLVRAQCIHAKVVGGNALVNPPTGNQASYPVSFEMFGGKRLGPGWIIKSLRVSNGTFVQQPRYDSDDASFVLRLTSQRGQPAARASVTSLVLEGPGTASSWQEAFRTAIASSRSAGTTTSTPPPPPPLGASNQ